MLGTVLDREEYIEQAYFFRMFRERLEENAPAQTILASIHEEILSTTKLPIAIEFLRGEILHTGRLSDGMRRLGHYFTPFQALVIGKAEEDRARLEQKVALEILQREAEYRASTPTPSGLFVYQFESISRNKLGYDQGMSAMAQDPFYEQAWRDWILKARLQLGTIDFADLIWFHSEQFAVEKQRLLRDPDFAPQHAILFGAKEGKIAAANRGKDPLYMFAALQRQLGYPTVPRTRLPFGPERDIPQMQARLRMLEQRMQLIEAELKGQFDLSQFYVRPPAELPDEDGWSPPAPGPQHAG